MKDFAQGNFLRAMLGELDGGDDLTDEIIELSCNLDDMTPEQIAYATELLMEEGARDVYTTSIGMKKGRPGILLTVLCDAGHRESMVRLMFRHTSTIGIRETVHHRYVLRRTVESVDTEYGPVHVKRSSGYGTEHVKAELEDLAGIARAEGRTLAEVAERVVV